VIDEAMLALRLSRQGNEAHMSKSHDGLRAQAGDGLVRVMFLVNFAAAASVFALWPNYSEAIGDPVSIVAARGRAVSSSVIEYPNILLWAIPVAAVCGSYLCRSMHMRALARLFAFFPAALTGAALAWLYFINGYWNQVS
jgi:hypothetical protein